MGWLPLIFSSSGLLAGLLWWKHAMNKNIQYQLDTTRRSYEVVFPRGTTEQQVTAWLQSIGGGLRRTPNAVPTLVSEVRWTGSEVKHILRIPASANFKVLGQLDGHLSGATVNPIELKKLKPTLVVEVFMTNTQRMLRVERSTVKTLATAILRSVPPLSESETVTYQLILSNAENIKRPMDRVTKKSKPSLTDIISGNLVADSHEVSDRQRKTDELNYNAGIRIAVEADNDIRARELIGGVLAALRAAESNDVKLESHFVDHRNIKVREAINLALTPTKRKSAQLTITELAALIAPRFVGVDIPGMPQGAARRIAPTEAVARDGRILGHSNIDTFGQQRRLIALDHKYADRNMGWFGPIGSGKSVGQGNSFYDDVRRGMGGIVIDAAGSESVQSLYHRAKGYIPDDRIDDVIDIHVMNNADFPVAFDLFNQGLGRGAIDQIMAVFTGLYPDIDKGVSVRDLLYHGLWTLIESGLNLTDLEPLLRPKPSELAWAQSIIRKLRNPELRAFWERMKQGGWGSTENGKRTKWDTYSEPLYRRLWQLVGRPEIRYMVGQTTTEGKGLNWEKVLRENKIVLISLAGLPPETAQLIANLLVNSLWTTAQKFDSKTLSNANAVYLDEFQVSASIKGILEDMLARSRRHMLNVVLGTQYITGIPHELQDAVFNNVLTRVIYPVRSAKEADAWARNMASDTLTSWDFQNGRRYEPIVQVETDIGSQIVTIKALPPYEDTGNAGRVTTASRSKYGTPVENVRQQIINRRREDDGDSFGSGASGVEPAGPLVGPYQMTPDEFEQLGM